MTAAEQRAQQLDVLERLESLRIALDEAIGVQRRMLAATAVTTPPLAGSAQPHWVWSSEAARIIGIEKPAMTQRARRGIRTGIARKVGGRWQVRLDLMAPAGGRRAP